jgi:hypothetical protein
MNVLWYPNRQAAEQELAQINENLRQLLIAEGGVDAGESGVIPLNGATGEPDYHATRTICWDVIQETADGTGFHIAAPDNPVLLEGVTATAQSYTPPNQSDESAG